MYAWHVYNSPMTSTVAFQTELPRAPVFWRVAPLLVSLAASGCGQSPTEPGSLQPPSNVVTPAQPNNLAGSVIEFDTSGETRPVTNLRMKVRTAGPGSGPIGGTELPDVVTDQNGRFVIENVTAPVLFVETAPGSAYHFLCSQYPIIRSQFFGPPQLPVVPDNWSSDSVPGGILVHGTSVQGKVQERVGDTLQPVAGAKVALDGGTLDPAATTNAVGYYMVCSVVGTDQYRDLSIEKAGYQTVTRRILGGIDFKVNVELTRR